MGPAPAPASTPWLQQLQLQVKACSHLTTLELWRWSEGGRHVIWTWLWGRAVVRGRRGEGFASRVWIHFCWGSRGQAWDSWSLLFLRFLCFLFFISSWDGS
jgi:hypothetical protein